MNILDNLLEFVNSQLIFHRKAIEKHADDPRRRRLHSITAAKFEELLAAMKEAAARLDATPAPVAPEASPLELNPEDLIGLPSELLAQLNITESDKLDGAIVEIIASSGGTMLLDKLLIALYKRTGEIQQRNQLISRLYRLSKKGKVFSVPKKKGFYTTIRPEHTEEHADKEEENS